ncbi:SDR family NAD(P)-dependent oxidoreductase [Conexibacter sp. JD483]|uniref:SDR family NAD(P)-dependent oxidoreductase n=1 Tax=unclassified Conexibacter TaxID=2627773 RepID=UPI00272309D4|nr:MULTISPECIES: SDR family NAD(P)-dependent oxidoreductase [unclassified Conexibacter]MDO8187829.1 SDR family NAD(P)-dependent oxidoreductase [Conexibacter sp. CPCC 205706]MDO8199962.1 SDR family NAD(P)-dependent oxidoreductase [Conexibacter sp. CPCC 205762]MDR9369489.1 SDR family NAD(P)-dependent oxidoreductase [Conexibacter sp. JD483]
MLESGLGGRVCLVTGAANGIGRACAELLAGEGARLALCDLDGERLEEVGGDAALRVAADLSRRAQVTRLLAATRERFGRLDVLIHCAGIYRVTPLPQVTDAEWDQLLDVNLRSAFLLAQGAVELMREGGDGRIVLVGSFAARTGGLRASAPYAASKAGVEGLTRHLAQYAGPLGVRVNCLHPGFTETPMTSILGEEAREEALRRTPLRRHCGPAEQASMAVVLASDLAAFVHGATLDVNGGMYMA